MNAGLIQQLRGASQETILKEFVFRSRGLESSRICYVLLALLAIQLTLPAQGQYLYTTNNGSLTITQYTGKGGAVTVPPQITGLPVTSIANFAFYSSSNLTSVSISEGITNIGFEAFYSCTGLTNVALPGSINGIGDWAFQNCPELTQIIVGTLNPLYSGVGGVLFDKNQTTLVSYPAGKSGSYSMPNSVTNIGVGAFGGCLGLTDVSMAGKLLNIGDSAFYSCTKLASVAIPDGVTNVGNSAFYSCSSLTNATVGNGVRSIGDYGFASCSSLATTTIGSNVTSIGYGAFSGSGLTSLDLPNNVSKLGDAAFEYCSNLTSITIGSGLVSIPNFAFDACTSLTRLTMGNTLASIGVDAFGRCAHLGSVIIPSGVTNMGDSAFLNCTNLTAAYFLGNPPANGGSAFGGDDRATIYYLPERTGWGPTYDGLPTAAWNLQIQTSDAGFGVKGNQFEFNITGASNLAIVVEVRTNWASGLWSPLKTNVLAGGTAFYSDPQWTNSRTRFYRIRSP